MQAINPINTHTKFGKDRILFLEMISVLLRYTIHTVPLLLTELISPAHLLSVSFLAQGTRVYLLHCDKI